MKFIKNVIQVFFTNLINYGSSLIVGFILPLVLTVQDYGRYREYILYLSFAYIFNIGYNDGIYIHYGGENLKELDQNKLAQNRNFIIYFQLLISLIMLTISLFLKKTTLLLFSIATFFVLVNTYYQNFYQAVGKFKIFSVGNIIKSFTHVILLLVFIFVFRFDNYLYYVGANIISMLFLFFYYENKNKSKLGFRFDFKRQLSFFKIGFFILIGNMSVAFVGNIGNWFANVIFDLETFAQYSFQSSILSISLLIINAVSLVFYNFIAKNNNTKVLKLISHMCILLGISSGVFYFFVKFIVVYFLKDYIQALSILKYTFLAAPYIMITNIIITNLYKTKKSEKVYFKNSILFAVFSFVLLVILTSLFSQIEIIAIGTVLCYISWVAYNLIFVFPTLRFSKNELSVLFLHLVTYLTSVTLLNTMIGLTLYFIFIVFMLFLTRNDLKYILNTIIPENK